MALDIAVYADWVGLPEPLRLGWLHARRGAGRELFEFEFDAAALVHPASEADNLMDLELARSVAPYFRVSKQQVEEIIEQSRAVVRQWPKLAAGLKIGAREQERMAGAFRLAG